MLDTLAQIVDLAGELGRREQKLASLHDEFESTALARFPATSSRAGAADLADQTITRARELAAPPGPIVALKPVKVRIAHPVEIREIDYEYLRQEYGVTKTELDRFKKRSEADYQKAKREGAFIRIENPTLEKIEEALNRPAPSAKRAARAAKKRKR